MSLLDAACIGVLRKVKRSGADLKLLLFLIRQVEFFRPLDYQTQLSLCNVLQLEEISTGKVLFEEGELGNKFYVIAKGSVEIYRSDDKGRNVRLVILSSGQSFGELALVALDRRSASVRALSDCQFLTIRRQEYREYVLSSCQDLDIKCDFIRGIPSLARLRPASLILLCTMLFMDTYPRGHVLLTEGEACERMFFLQSGTCGLSRKLRLENPEPVVRKRPKSGFALMLNSFPRRSTTQSLRLCTVGVGEYFGGDALFNQIPIYCSIECLTECKVLVLDKHCGGHMNDEIRKKLVSHGMMQRKFHAERATGLSRQPCCIRSSSCAVKVLRSFPDRVVRVKPAPSPIPRLKRSQQAVEKEAVEEKAPEGKAPKLRQVVIKKDVSALKENPRKPSVLETLCVGITNSPPAKVVRAPMQFSGRTSKFFLTPRAPAEELTLRARFQESPRKRPLINSWSEAIRSATRALQVNE